MNTPTKMLTEMDKSVAATTACVSSLWFMKMLSRGTTVCDEVRTGFNS